MSFSPEEIRVLKALAAGLLNATGSASAVAEVADDAELDGKFGNATIRKDPSAKYYTGPSNVGNRLSDCDAEYLDAFAKWKDACAHMNAKDGGADKAKYADYDRKDAARARGWARRIRAGWKPAPQQSSLEAKPPSYGDVPDYGAPPDDGMDGIPF